MHGLAALQAGQGLTAVILVLFNLLSTRRCLLVAQWNSPYAGRCAFPAMDCQQRNHRQGASRQPQQPPQAAGAQLTDWGHSISQHSFATERQLCQAAWGSALGFQSAACERLGGASPSGNAAKECQASTWTGKGRQPGEISQHLSLQWHEGSDTWLPHWPGCCLFLKMLVPPSLVAAYRQEGHCVGESVLLFSLWPKGDVGSQTERRLLSMSELPCVRLPSSAAEI